MKIETAENVVLYSGMLLAHMSAAAYYGHGLVDVYVFKILAVQRWDQTVLIKRYAYINTNGMHPPTTTPSSPFIQSYSDICGMIFKGYMYIVEDDLSMWISECMDDDHEYY